MQITDPNKIDQYYQALLDRNQSFVGIFYVGVKTTDVFCIATCRARKPKRKNVIFYDSFKDALAHGYRPCKICKPTENANQAPAQVEQAIQLVKDHPKEKISDELLKAKGISSVAVRRWFNQHYGMTFHAYQRMYRMNIAFQELKNGKRTTQTAFESGYESLSGFGYTYKKLLGKSPKRSSEQNLILVHRFTTPLGPMFVCATDKGICLLEFVERDILEKEFEELQKRLKATVIAGENEHVKQVKKEIAEYFEGKRKTFDVSLDMPGTDFQKAVWQHLLTIPIGAKTTYQTIAEKIEKPKAVRAVGAANGRNRISIIVPCHRVIGSDGKLRGYGGGIERKEWLLAHEQRF